MLRLWLRLLSVVLIAIALVSFQAPTTPVAAGGMANDFVPGEVVVKLRQASDLPAVAATYNLDPTPIDQFGSRPIYHLRIRDGVSPPEKAAAMALDLRLAYAEPNYVGATPEGRQDYIWATGATVGGYAAQWAPEAMQLARAQRVTRGAGVTVAVLDTGVDRTHPALAGRLVPGYDFVDFDSDPSEVGVYGIDRGFGHGTHVAGLVALAAPDAKIMPVRVLDPSGRGNAWVLAEALTSIAGRADVASLSLSTTVRSRLLRDVIGALTCAPGAPNTPDDLPCFTPGGRGTVVILAAGNSARSPPEYPAGDGVGGSLAVGAGTPARALAPFSNFGSWVDVLAPGTEIVSTVPGGGYGTWSGTSMATPLVAGQVALVRAVCPGLESSKVVQLIVKSSDRIAGQVSHHVNAAAAVTRGCGDE